MFISDKIIYLELQKTGCSHIRKLLASIPDCNGQIVGKHNTIGEVDAAALGNISAKIKAGNIRNPWDWYVSLWAFGSMGKGGFIGHLMNMSFLKKLKNPRNFFIPVQEWKKVYADAENPALFRLWLKMILASERKKDIREGYGKSKMSAFCGLMTYRYMKLYTYNFEKRQNTITNYDELVAFETKNNLLDFVLKNEQLEDDFRKLMQQIHIPEIQINQVLNVPKTNSSQRKDYHGYFDEETIELVRNREKLIIEKYQYAY